MMFLRQRLFHQLQNLTVASHDLRTLRSQPEMKDVLWRLRDLRYDGMWRLPGHNPGWHPLADYAEWARHRLNVAFGISRGLRGDFYDIDHLSKRDIALLLLWLQTLDGEPNNLCLRFGTRPNGPFGGTRTRCLLPTGHGGCHDDYGSSWPD